MTVMETVGQPATPRGPEPRYSAVVLPGEEEGDSQVEYSGE